MKATASISRKKWLWAGWGLGVLMLVVTCCLVPIVALNNVDREIIRATRAFARSGVKLIGEDSHGGSSATGCAGGNTFRLYGTDRSLDDVVAEYDEWLSAHAWTYQPEGDHYPFIDYPYGSWHKAIEERSLRGYRLEISFIGYNDEAVPNGYNILPLDGILIDTYSTLFLIRITYGKGISCF